jgi:hypothetical protein
MLHLSDAARSKRIRDPCQKLRENGMPAYALSHRDLLMNEAASGVGMTAKLRSNRSLAQLTLTATERLVETKRMPSLSRSRKIKLTAPSLARRSSRPARHPPGVKGRGGDGRDVFASRATACRLQSLCRDGSIRRLRIISAWCAASRWARPLAQTSTPEETTPVRSIRPMGLARSSQVQPIEGFQTLTDIARSYNVSHSTISRLR